MSKHANNPSGLIDTLKLTDEQWAELARKLDNAPSNYTGQRRHIRVEYKKLAQIAVAIKVSATQWAKYIVRSRDLSEGGIGFLHGSYVYEGTACRVILKKKNGEVMCLDGVVKHCNHISGTVHKIGVQFNEPIDLCQFTDAMGQADPIPDDSQGLEAASDAEESENTGEAA